MQRLFLALVAFLLGLNDAQRQSKLRNGGIAEEPTFHSEWSYEFIRSSRTRPDLNRSTTPIRTLHLCATALTAPPAARKAYGKAAREMGKERPDLAKAVKELEKA